MPTARLAQDLDNAQLALMVLSLLTDSALMAAELTASHALTQYVLNALKASTGTEYHARLIAHLVPLQQVEFVSAQQVNS